MSSDRSDGGGGDDWGAERIRRLREREGLTQQDLAAELGVSKSSVEFWEMGQRTPSELNQRKLRKLETSASDEWLHADTFAEAIVALQERAADSGMSADEWYAEQLEAILERHLPDGFESEHVMEARNG